MGSNRKERRAAGLSHTKGTANGSSTAFQHTTDIDEAGVEYILKHPDYSGPKGKSLFDLADERQRELNKLKPGWKEDEGKFSSGVRPFDDDDLIGPFGDALLYSSSMAILHLTFDVLVYNQYREDIVWREIIKRAASAFPIFLTLVYLTHVEFSKRFPHLRNLIFMVSGIVAGCYLVQSGNQHGYFYVMKAAPPIASLWIWSVVEMNVAYAAASALAVLAYSWWNGFNLF